MNIKTNAICLDFGAISEYEEERYREHFRHTGIGASEISAIAGLSPWQTRKKLFHEKIGSCPRQETEAMKIGKFLEPRVFAYFEQYHFPTRCFYNREELIYQKENGNFNAFCTPDGYIELQDGEQALMEIKITSYFSKEKFQCAEAQVQYAMHILEMQSAKICILQGTKAEIITVPRDAAAGQQLYDLAKAFWINHILTGIEPEV